MTATLPSQLWKYLRKEEVSISKNLGVSKLKWGAESGFGRAVLWHRELSKVLKVSATLCASRESWLRALISPFIFSSLYFFKPALQDMY